MVKGLSCSQHECKILLYKSLAQSAQKGDELGLYNPGFFLFTDAYLWLSTSTF